MNKFWQFCAKALSLLGGSVLITLAVSFYFDLPFSGFKVQRILLSLAGFLLWFVHAKLRSRFWPVAVFTVAVLFKNIIDNCRVQWVKLYISDPVAAAAAGPFPISKFMEWSIFVNLVFLSLLVNAFASTPDKKST